MKMAETVSDPRRREVRQGLVSTALTTLAQGVQWLLLALLFSILTEWAGMVLWWPEEGLQHSSNSQFGWVAERQRPAPVGFT